MDVIEFRYRPVSYIRFTRKFSKKIPASWDEMKIDHLLALSKLYCDMISDPEFIRQFVGYSKSLSKKLSEIDVYYLYNQIKFIDKRDPIDHFIIERIDFEKKIYPSPKTRLKDVTFGEFVLFDSLFIEYDQDNIKQLDKFINALYKTDVAHRLPYYIKYAVALNYSLMREWLALGYTHLFKKSDSKKTSKTKSGNWLPVLDMLIKDDLAHAEEIENVPLHTVLRKLNNDIKESYKNVKV